MTGGAEPERLLVVGAREPRADGVITLDLLDPAGADLPAWAPGAHVDLVLADGLVRQYSLCGDPADLRVWRVAVQREPGGRGGSELVHTKLERDAAVLVRGPRNHFPLEPAQGYLFIAGGIGITPIVPMVAAAEAAGAEWSLTYGGRTATSMAFAAELASAYGDRVRLRPLDEHGLLDLDALLSRPRPGVLVYCCGPEGLIEAVERRCAAWPPGTLHVERFTPRDVGEPVRSRPFEVELAVTGVTLTVPPDRSILEVLEEAGVPILSSCREGTCGTCETEVLAGEVDHRDSLLTEEERAAGDIMYVCVSRAASPRLVLGL
ncbi:oxidoreductase [Microbispora sp. RL4-1S]|uniref:Oxidoreductase n=1 Tax=Microbispora oryzae TaxID=2806554 RepID=A0A940WM15_9ACTN|nr:PDR/VanB family oxidoreductase [Microbispora oryzae]MBP2703950.1 oxidoreductase [Microbispora oryzae]